MFSRTAVMAAVLALGASASWAQDPRFEIGANAGWTLSDGVSGGPILAGDGNLYNTIDPEDSFSWGADIGFFINENTSIGFLYSQQKSKMVIGGGIEREVGDWSIHNYHGVATYHFGDVDATARPFVFGGAGITQYGEVDFIGANGQARSTGGESQFSTTWGAGVKVYPSETVGLKLGVRWTPTYIKSDADGWWCDPYWGCYVVGDAQYSNQFEFSGGITLRF